MSWDLHIIDKDGDCAQIKEAHQEGGTICLATKDDDGNWQAGTTDASLNITWNYGKIFHFRTELDGKSCKEAIPLLEKQVKKLGTKRNNDYWKATDGNVGHACSLILDWCKQHPEGSITIW